MRTPALAALLPAFAVLAPSCSLIVDVGAMSRADADGSDFDGDLSPPDDADSLADDLAEAEADGGADDDATDDTDGEDGGSSCGNTTVESGEECDDGNDASGDGCEPGSCVFSCHRRADCDDSDPCTVDSCDSAGDGQACTHAPNPGVACDDSNPCTHTDRCDADGLCAGTSYVCEPAECVAATECDGDGGCTLTFDPVHTSCNDGDPCTTPDTCDGGGLCSGPNTCDCPGGTTAECATFEDGNLCNGTLRCVSGLCEVDPATVVSCPANPPCGSYSCTPATGVCGLGALPVGISCEDGLYCNGAETCIAGGTCSAGPLPCPIGGCIAGCDESVDVCRAATAVTVCRAAAPGGCDVAETCDGTSTGCPTDSFATDGTGCSDGNACTGGDACSGGICVGGAPPIDVCDGTDNDCDGTTDEGFDCRLGAAESCTTSCSSTGNRSCGAGCMWGDCAGTEVCGNGADDDCDTQTDEDCSTCTPPATPTVTACPTSWDRRPIVEFNALPSGVTYELYKDSDAMPYATIATVGQNYYRPAAALGPGGPLPGGTTMTIFLKTCRVSDPTCCAISAPATVAVIEACTIPVAPTASNVMFSEYVVNGDGTPCPGDACEAGEAIEVANLSNCPVTLAGTHFGYQNSTGGSYRWMNFGAEDVIPPRGVFLAIRNVAASTCSYPFLGPDDPGLFGLKISTQPMQGSALTNGWFNNSGGGTSALRVATGAWIDIVSGTTIDIISPYLATASECQSIGFDAIDQCGNVSAVSTPTTRLDPNQLGRLWLPCDAVVAPVPASCR